LLKGEQSGIKKDIRSLNEIVPVAKEVELIKILRKFAYVVKESATTYSPALIANYCYELAREYNQFYHDHTILGETNEAVRNFRLLLSGLTSEILSEGMWLLGIEMPERM
jgi:arginyl-tRNA synthetase